MAYPHKWSPISYKSSAGQRKHIEGRGRRCKGAGEEREEWGERRSPKQKFTTTPSGNRKLIRPAEYTKK